MADENKLLWKRLLWVDVETTGLDADRDDLLEVGMVVTDGNLNERAAFRVLVSPERELRMSPEVVDMHRASGLIVDARCHGYHVKDAELTLEHDVQENFRSERGRVILCGSTVGFDKAFLKKHMPTLS